MRKAKKAAPKKTLTAAEIDKRRAEWFFEMEEPLRDCSDRAEIVATLLRSGRLNLCENVRVGGKTARPQSQLAERG